ncbi:MAG: hypothetical protein ACOCUR_01475 [Nanoarchaeota archaeon]
MRNKKAQSAVEFLVTYGWAFMMVLGFIGALFYLDVLNFSRLVPDKCEFSSEVDCQEKIILEEFPEGEANGRIYVKLVNNMGSNIRILGCSISVPGVEASSDFCLDTEDACGTGASDLLYKEWPQGESLLFNFSQCKTTEVGLLPGRKKDIDMEIEFHAIGSPERYRHFITGKIFTRVEPVQ